MTILLLERQGKNEEPRLVGKDWEELLTLISLVGLICQGFDHLTAFRGWGNYYFIDEKTELQRR